MYFSQLALSLSKYTPLRPASEVYIPELPDVDLVLIASPGLKKCRKFITWDEMTQSEMNYMPAELTPEYVNIEKYKTIPLPGTV